MKEFLKLSYDIWAFIMLAYSIILLIVILTLPSISEVSFQKSVLFLLASITIKLFSKK